MYVASAYDNDQFVKRQINNKVTVFSFGRCFAYV